jgi:GNAT superfamily N-acetyltransferase
MMVTYQQEPNLSPEEFIDVLVRSTLAERRPVHDTNTIRAMLAHADLILTARADGVLVGVSRAITDFAYCTYLSDLAVDAAYQRQGLGRELIRRTHEAAGRHTTLILLAAPKAQQYYPHIGMAKHESCWLLTPQQGRKVVDVKVTFVQMFSRPSRVVPPPRDGLTVVHARKPTIAYYRYLYDAVGRQWQWTSRKKMSDEQLTAIIHDPTDEVYVLDVDGVPAGFAELDRRVEGEIEITQFGLVPEFIGQGLGKYFLQWAVDRAWTYQPKRLWLHTCNLDHPVALSNYLKAGFAIYKEETKTWEPGPG